MGEGGRAGLVIQERRFQDSMLFSYDFVLQSCKIKAYEDQTLEFGLISFWVSFKEGIQVEIGPGFLVRFLFHKGLRWKLFTKIKKEDKLLFSYIFVSQRCKIKVWWGQDKDEEDMGWGRYWEKLGFNY